MEKNLERKNNGQPSFFKFCNVSVKKIQSHEQSKKNINAIQSTRTGCFTVWLSGRCLRGRGGTDHFSDQRQQLQVQKLSAGVAGLQPVFSHPHMLLRNCVCVWACSWMRRADINKRNQMECVTSTFSCEGLCNMVQLIPQGLIDIVLVSRDICATFQLPLSKY